jgi:hypothetical protein
MGVPTVLDYYTIGAPRTHGLKVVDRPNRGVRMPDTHVHDSH